MLEVTSDAVASLDRQWRYTFLNRRAKELIDPDRRLLGKNVWEEFPAAVGSPAWDLYHRSMDERVSGTAEVYYPAPLNVWLVLQTHPTPEGIVVFFRDITERKRQDEVLREQHELLASVQQNAKLATWEVDLASQRIHFGPGSYPVLGHDLASISTFGGYMQALNPEDLPHIRQVLQAAIAQDQSFVVQFRAIAATGETIWVESRGHVEYRDGAPTRLRGLSLDVTERRRSEEVMRAQQELLAVVQQASRVATFDIDLVTQRVAYGPSSYPVYGRPHAELTTLDDFRKIRLPQHTKTVEASVARALATLQPETVEFAVRAPDGEAAIWIESRYQAIVVDGSARYLRGISLDVTERKRSEAVLIASEERYRVLADLNPQALWAGGPDGEITYANQGLLDYIGLTLADLPGGGWLKAFAPSERERVMATWRRSVATGDDYDIEALLCRASDQSLRWWNLRALPVRDERGAITSWLGVGQDIHDARTAAEALRLEQQETERKRAELETVYRTAPIGLSLVDPVEFRFLRINQREAEILGRPEHEVIGRTVMEIAPIPGLLAPFQQAARGIPVKDHLLEGELPPRPGDRRAWTVNYYPVFGPSGRVEAISTAAMEITNQRRSEAALIQSEKLAAVGRLASSISHEINNPLEAVTNLLYLVGLTPDLSADTKTYIHMAQSELSRVSQIVTQTLRFHRQAVAPTLVTPQDLAGAVLNLYQGRLTNSGIKVDARYRTATRILCFENDIRQVLNNLIANAIDAMRGGGRLVLRAHDARGADDVPGVRITIADSGHGMTPDVQERIFEPFFTTKDLNGTGLGLWISAGIVHRHQGRLDVRSTTHPVHHGTVFTLFLPLSAKEPPQPT
jgi:PAS domain S-box-containing protein